MKRDMNLVRTILLKVESAPHGFATANLQIEGFNEEQIGYHSALLIEAGLADGVDFQCQESESPQAQINRLTWAGHEFLDAAREQGRWNQARELLEKHGGAPIQVWTGVLTKLVLNSLSL